MQTPTYFYWTLAQPEQTHSLQECIHSARKAGVFIEFHAIVETPIEDCSCYHTQAPPTPDGLDSLIYLRGGLKHLPHDYAVWIDPGTKFRRAPDHLLSALGASPIHVPLRRCDPVDNPWIDSENSRRLIDALRRGGVSDPGFVAEPGFWIIKSNAIDTLFRLVSDFVPIARSAGLAPDMTACLSYAMQMLCADPESHQIGHHADIWLPVLDADSLTTIKAEGRSPLVQGRVGNQVWVADPCIVGNVREPLPSGSLKTGAFTLIELLTVIATLGILAALILPALSGARGKGKRVQCVNNMRQLAMAQMVYSHDNEQGYFTPQRAPEDQNLNWLLQQVGRGGNLFVCPSTKNQVRDIEGTSKNGETGVVDLFAAAGTAGAGYGHSYWQVGFMVLNGPYSSRVSFPGGEATLPYLRKTTSIVGSHRHFHDAFGLKGSVAGPSRSWMLMDWTMSENIHYPDVGDNHGAGGSNVAMCDGHVEWVEARDFVFKYEMSQDDNRSKIEF